MKCYIDGIVGEGNQSPFAVAFFISVKRHKLSCYVRENTSPTLQCPCLSLPSPACCQLLLFCLLSICNKCICDVKDACDMRYSTTATERRTSLVRSYSLFLFLFLLLFQRERNSCNAHLCPCPCPFCCCCCSPDMRYFSYNSCRCLD